MRTRWRMVIWPEDSVRRFFHLLLLLYVIKQVLTAIIMPPFTGHDEVAHFQYIRTVATEQRLPKIPELQEWRDADTATRESTGDFFDPDLYPYSRWVLDWFQYGPDDARHDAYVNSPIYAVTYPDYRNPPDWESWPNGWQYAGNHPPLYYVISTPVYWVTDWMSLENQMISLRMVAIPFGLLALMGTFIMSRRLFPTSGFIAIGATTFVAFQTQISYEAAMINNDILVIGFGAMLLALLTHGMARRFTWRLVISIGVLFGLMLLSKGSSLVFAAPVALMMAAGIGWRRWREWVPKGAAAAAIGFGMSAPWYLFLYRTYGNLSGLDQVAELQYMFTYEQGLDKPSVWDLVWNERFAVMRWNESWGEFGWRMMPLDNTLLWWIGVPCAIMLAGFLFYAGRLVVRRKQPAIAGSVDRPVGWQIWAMVAFFVTALLGYAAVIQFGLTFQLTQARYFFPMIAPAAILLMVGLHTIVPRRGRRYAQVVVVGAMIALNVYIYSAYVVPNWYDRLDPVLRKMALGDGSG